MNRNPMHLSKAANLSQKAGPLHPEDMASYIDQHNLPRHPLVAKGFKSIGCFPCTTSVGINEDASGGVRRLKMENINVIVNDGGFSAEDWRYAFHEFEHIDALSDEQKEAVAIDLPNDTDGAVLLSKLHEIDLIRIGFPSFADGRGFSLARQLRTLGYHGRLRAKGHVIPDQYAMARRPGFDEVEIDANLAKRQPEAHWLSRKDWQNGDYQRRLLQSL